MLKYIRLAINKVWLGIILLLIINILKAFMIESTQNKKDPYIIPFLKFGFIIINFSYKSLNRNKGIVGKILYTISFSKIIGTGKEKLNHQIDAAKEIKKKEI